MLLIDASSMFLSWCKKQLSNRAQLQLMRSQGCLTHGYTKTLQLSDAMGGFPWWLEGVHPRKLSIPKDPYMPYMVTFTINLPQMLAYIPYMDPLGMESGFCSPLLAGILLVRASYGVWASEILHHQKDGWTPINHGINHRSTGDFATIHWI